MAKESVTPRILMIAGPNGAGKTTVTPRILKKAYDIAEWVNADVIARGLSGLQPESAAWEAGRVMIDRLLAGRPTKEFRLRNDARGSQLLQVD